MKNLFKKLVAKVLSAKYWILRYLNARNAYKTFLKFKITFKIADQLPDDSLLNNTQYFNVIITYIQICT